MTTQQPEALRLAEQYDYGDPAAHSNTWKVAVCTELLRQHVESETLRAGYAAARLEIESLKAQLVERAKEHADELTVAYMCGASREKELAAQQPGAATAAPENIRGILARCRDFIDTTKATAYPAGADLADEIDVLLAAQPAPQPSHVAQAVVPSGWNIVPTEPTQAMLDAVVTSMDDFLLGKEAEKQYREDWAAMLAAATAQPVAPQGVAYAALPTSSYAGRVYEEGFLIGTCPLYNADKMRAFADATHTLRAAHGQAPAGAAEEIDKALNVYAQAFAARVNGWTRQNGDDLPGARSALFAAIHAYARASTRPSPTAQSADRVQEDAALWRWLAEYLVGPRTDLDDEIVASETVNDLRKLVKVAIKQGEKQ